MASSSSNFTSHRTAIPSCDAWGNIQASVFGQVPTVMGSAGVSNAYRKTTGVYGISFSNPERFGGGAYAILYTPEVSSGIPCLLSTNRGVDVLGLGGNTAAGLTTGFTISTWGFPGPLGVGGNTATRQDFPAGTMYMNFAVFSFSKDTDLRSPAVANFQSWSENISNWASNNSTQFSAAPSVVDPYGNYGGVFSLPGISTGASNFIGNLLGSYDKTYTWSIHAKSNVNGTTLMMLFGGGGNNFGYEYNLKTGAVSPAGTGVDAIVNKGATFSNGKISTLGNDWYRLSMTGRIPSAAISPPIPLVVNQDYTNNDFFVFGAQLEEGSVVTPYIKTAGTVPVLGNQDARKNLVPGASGFGVTGSTYSSAMPNLLSKRSATAYGTIVIPPNTGNASNVSAYIENGFNVTGVSAGSNSIFDVSFVKPMTNSNYCVLLCGEYEPVNTGSQASDYTNIWEYSMLMVDRTKKDTSGFRAVSLKQDPATNNWTPQSIAYQSGLMERIHFIVFGGATYGQP